MSHVGCFAGKERRVDASEVPCDAANAEEENLAPRRWQLSHQRRWRQCLRRLLAEARRHGSWYSGCCRRTPVKTDVITGHFDPLTKKLQPLNNRAFAKFALVDRPKELGMLAKALGPHAEQSSHVIPCRIKARLGKKFYRGLKFATLQ
jgi:hypothetical protein